MLSLVFFADFPNLSSDGKHIKCTVILEYICGFLWVLNTVRNILNNLSTQLNNMFNKDLIIYRQSNADFYIV